MRAGRVRKRATQRRLGGLVGLSQSTISRAERGLGGGLTVDAWQRISLAVDRPLVVRLQRDIVGETVDAGHLAIQELVLRLGRAAGYRATFELATRSAEPWRSVDVGLRDDRRNQLLIVECWNTIGDVGSAARTSERKVTEAKALASALWGEVGGTVSEVWVVRATKRNRSLLARYPEVFAARFPASSAAWVRVLVDGGPPPREPGLVWSDLSATRLHAWRRG